MAQQLRNIRKRYYANEGASLAQAAIPRPAVHRGQVTNRDRAILQRGVTLPPIWWNTLCNLIILGPPDLIAKCISILQMNRSIVQL